MIRRAFSLIELLLAVFILAIGIISISALFPAGIAQQQMAADEQMGPAVAEQALNVIRSKVRPEDFGSFEQFGVFDIGTQSQGGVWRPVPGDWSWMRPAILTQNVGDASLDETGAVDLFSNYAEQNAGGGTISLEEFPTGGVTTGSGGKIYGIPYNASKYSLSPPVMITQRERYWPMVGEGLPIVTPPQYAWDVMFRKFGGRVQVALFVYRVIAPGGSARAYQAVQSVDGSGYPPVPYRRMTASNNQSTGGPSSVPAAWLQPAPPAPLPAPQSPPAAGPYGNGALSTGIVAAGDFPSSTQFPQHQWQLPGQWLLENNGHVLRVTQGRKVSNADPAVVRLSAPIPRVPSAQIFGDYEDLSMPVGVRALWYVPAFDAAGNQLVPIYATVRDL